MRILIIDRNRNITDVLSKYIKLKGFDVKTVNDGKKGLESINNEEFDVILLDITLPEFNVNNLSMLLERRKKLKKNKIIVLTASSISQRERDKLINNGIDLVLEKPILLSKLLDVLTIQDRQSI